MDLWKNASKRGFDIHGDPATWDGDLTDGMLGGKVLEDNVVYINNGDPPKIPEKKPLTIEGEMFYCGQDCLRCNRYDCKLEGF